MILLLLLALAPGLDGEIAETKMLSLLMKGRFALAEGDYRHASELADQALDLNANEPEAAFLKVEVLMEMRTRQPLLARQIESDLILLLRDYLLRFPDDYRFHKMMGVRLANRMDVVRLKDLETPDFYLEKAIRLLATEPGNQDLEKADAYYYLGIWHYNNKAFFDAGEAFRQVVVLEVDADWAWFYGARSLEESHQLNDAVRFYSKYQESAGDNTTYRGPNIAFNILSLKVILDESEANMAALIDFFKRENFDREVILSSANRFLSLSRREICLRLLALVDPATRDDTYYALFFQAMSALHRFDDLYRELATAMAAPQNLSPRATIARYAQEAALLARDFKAAVSMRNWRGPDRQGTLAGDVYAAFAAAMDNGDTELWSRVSEWHGMDPALNTIGSEILEHGLRSVAAQAMKDLYMTWSDWASALDAQMIVQAGRKRGDRASDDLAVLYYLMGDHERAFGLYEDLLRHNPDRHDFLNNYGYFLAERGVDLEKARACLERAISGDANNGAYLDSMGWILYKIGDYSRAESFLHKALAEEPDDLEKLDHLGDVLYAQGRVAEARRHWSRAMSGGCDRYLAILQKLDPP